MYLQCWAACRSCIRSPLLGGREVSDGSLLARRQSDSHSSEYSWNPSTWYTNVQFKSPECIYYYQGPDFDDMSSFFRNSFFPCQMRLKKFSLQKIVFSLFHFSEYFFHRRLSCMKNFYLFSLGMSYPLSIYSIPAGTAMVRRSRGLPVLSDSLLNSDRSSCNARIYCFVWRDLT